jgi:hypothetical protein
LHKASVAVRKERIKGHRIREQLEKSGSKDIEFVIKFMEIIKQRPDIEKRLREFYEDRLKEQRK